MTEQELTELCERVIGSKETAEEWISHEAIALDRKRPVDMMSSAEDRAEVELLLKQIEAGVYI